MRTLTLTLTLNPEDGRFDPLTGDEMKARLNDAIDEALHLWPEEFSIAVIADAYEPTVPR